MDENLGSSAEGLDRVRMEWMQGKVAAASGHGTEARAAFEEVRREFTAREMAYDCALVTIDLSAMLLESGDTNEVRRLAAEMGWIFKAPRVHPQAVAALRLFCERVENGTMTVKLAQSFRAYFSEARNNPRLRFEA